MSRAALRRHAPWVGAALSVVALALAAVVGLTTEPSLHVQRLAASDAGWWTAYAVFSVVGGIVASRRPENLVGWLMLTAGAINAFAAAAGQYAVFGLVRHPGSLPGADVVAWCWSFLWTPSIAALILVIAFFPTGRLPSGRWRWLPVMAVGCTTVIVLVTAVDMWSRRGAALVADDTAWEQGTTAGHVIDALWPFVPICAIAAMVSVGVRYRRAGGAERQQLKWLVLAGIVSAPMIIVDELLPSGSPLATPVALLDSPAWAAIAIALAVLRYRLYDIDRIVSRTASYAVVTGLVLGGYVGLVALTETVLGFSSSVAVAASTLLVAAAFQPVRRRVQRTIDRRFDRAAYDAGRLAEAFAQRLRDQVDVDAVSSDLLTTVESAVAPASLTLWLARA
ncbi:MAG TPA: hypothetical protein VFJ98_01000 [Mycobacteriales bacterium]|nr:hypothetical protein [Mycobacteriales bacterium]